MNDDGEEEVLPEKQTPGLQAIHKAAAVLFLERVYGIPDQMTFFRLLEDCFLPDLRAATNLAAVRYSTDVKLLYIWVLVQPPPPPRFTKINQPHMLGEIKT